MSIDHEITRDEANEILSAVGARVKVALRRGHVVTGNYTKIFRKKDHHV